MRLWPFGRSDRVEARSDQSSYSDAVAEALLNQASGITPSAESLGAVEIGAGLWARALASAQVEPETSASMALTPDLLAFVGRQLATRGETVMAIDVGPMGLALTPASSWDIAGSANPMSWVYRLDLVGPSSTVTRVLPWESVIHLKYAIRPYAPWRGVGPLGMASKTKELAAYLERSLTWDAKVPTGYLMPLPDGISSAQGIAFKVASQEGRGGITAIETTAHGWGHGMQNAAPRGKDFEQSRFGPIPPLPNIDLRSKSQVTVLATMGIPLGLVEAAAAASLREQWRLFLHAMAKPLTRIITPELRVKLDMPTLRFNLSLLAASDIGGRARAYMQLINAGMPPDQAAAETGIGTA